MRASLRQSVPPPAFSAVNGTFQLKIPSFQSSSVAFVITRSQATVNDWSE